MTALKISRTAAAAVLTALLLVAGYGFAAPVELTIVHFNDLDRMQESGGQGGIARLGSGDQRRAGEPRQRARYLCRRRHLALPDVRLRQGRAHDRAAQPARPHRHGDRQPRVRFRTGSGAAAHLGSDLPDAGRQQHRQRRRHHRRRPGLDPGPGRPLPSGYLRPHHARHSSQVESRFGHPSGRSRKWPPSRARRCARRAPTW